MKQKTVIISSALLFCLCVSTFVLSRQSIANPKMGGGDSIIKGWVAFDAASGVVTDASYNVSSINDNDVGDYTIYWDNDFAAADEYAVVVTSNAYHNVDYGKAAGSYSVRTYNSANTIVDVNRCNIIAIGDLQ